MSSNVAPFKRPLQAQQLAALIESSATVASLLPRLLDSKSVNEDSIHLAVAMAKQTLSECLDEAKKSLSKSSYNAMLADITARLNLPDGEIEP